MPQQSISSGATKKLIDLDRFGAVSIRPEGGDIAIGKHETSARSGEVVQRDERSVQVALRNESIYAHALDNNVTVNYRKQGFLNWFIQSFETKVIDRGTEATVNDNIVNPLAREDITAGNSLSATKLIENNSGNRQVIETFYASTADGYAEAVQIAFSIRNGNNVEQYRIYGNLLQYPILLDPGFPLKDTWQVYYAIINNSTTDIQIELGFLGWEESN